MSCCTKCQKEYNPRRVGGLFCSVSCGNSYRQQLKRNEQKRTESIAEGYAVAKPLTNEEVSLWSILLAFGADAKKILSDNELPPNEKPTDIGVRIRALLLNCQDKANSPLMKELSARYQAQQEAERRASAIPQVNKGKY